MAAWSVWRLEEAGAVSGQILSENYESVIAAQNMKEALERQDSGALFARLGDPARAERQIAENRQRFDAAFARAAGNVTEPGEQAIIDAIKSARDEYYRAMDERADYFTRLEPPFDRLRANLDRLLQLNQQAMVSKSANAQQVTQHALTMTLLLAGALIVAGFVLAFTFSVRIHRDADRLKSEFVGIASHELRTPLTTLQMGIELLQEQFAARATDRQREILEMCREDAARLERLVTDLLDLSRMASGHMKPALEVVPAAMLLRDAVKPSKPRIDAAHLDLVLEFDDSLPSVMADARQIERVLANLISNAVKATPQGGRITVSARRIRDDIQVSVADTGRGIPPEYVARLFEEFVQVPEAETGNAGLGLSISKRIINAHGGSIGAASVARPRCNLYLHAAHRGWPSASPIWRGTDMSRRVLVIDDETNIRRMIRITLEADGYEIEDAADGKTGLDSFGDGSRFDAVVLDQKMPGMDGLETLKQIRKTDHGRPSGDGHRLRIDRAGGRRDEGRRDRFSEETAHARHAARRRLAARRKAAVRARHVKPLRQSLRRRRCRRRTCGR